MATVYIDSRQEATSKIIAAIKRVRPRARLLLVVTHDLWQIVEPHDGRKAYCPLRLCETLSGLFSEPDEAWDDAAKRLGVVAE